MASSYSTPARLEIMAAGENDTTWGTKTSTNLQLLEELVGGYVAITHDNTANYTLTATNATADEARPMVKNIGGALSAARNAVVPTNEQLHIVKNATTGGYAVTVKTSGGTGISVPNGRKTLLNADGTNVVSALDYLPNLYVGGTLGINTNSLDSASDIEYTASGNLKRAYFHKNVTGALTGWDEDLSTFQVLAQYNGDQTGAALGSYELGQIGVHVKGQVGNSATAAGSMLMLAGNMQIYDTSNVSGGICEFSPLLGVLNCRNANTNTGVNLWHTDLNAYGPSSGQEGFIGAALMSVKYHSGTANDGTHTGVHGWYAVTKPQGGGGKDDGVTGLTSYPAHAGVRVVGWSGPQTATSGTHADATAGWTYGLHVGGNSFCGAWIGSPIRSKVVTGARLEDFTSYGLQIINRHTAATGHAIHVDSTAGNVGIHCTPDSSVPLSVGAAATPSMRTFVEASDLRVGSSATTEDLGIQVGASRTGDGAAYMDLVADAATYTDYGLRLHRAGSANGVSSLIHRGTGAFIIQNTDAAILRFKTNNTTYAEIAAAGTISLGGALGAESLRVTPVASAVNFITAKGAIATTGVPELTVGDSGDTNVGMILTRKGTGSFYFQGADDSAFVVEIGSGVTGNRTCGIDFHSDTTNTDYSARIQRISGVDGALDIINVGTGALVLRTGGNAQLQVINTASADRYLTITGSNGSNPTIGTSAGDIAITTNVTLGTGSVYKITGVQVVGPRDTGWTAMTGSTDKSTAYNTATVTLPQLAARVAAMQATWTTHGGIGA